MKAVPQFTIYSPDGFTINPVETYNSPKEAWEGFITWKKRYDQQGYYSTVINLERVQIPLDKLKEHCKLIEL